MKLTHCKKMLSLVLCMVLIAAMALSMSGCGSDTGDTTPTIPNAELQPVGQGETKFVFVAEDLSGNQTWYEVSTGKTTVGEALMELELISGESGPYGLYVKAVNGITLDYETDGKYWAFYVDGEYGLTGVDMTDIVPGSTYMFKPEA